MTLWKNYHRAKNLQDALETLETAQRADHSARLVAGGSDLLLDIQQGRQAPVDTLVDICTVEEMNLLEIRQGSLFIGAAVTLNQIIASSLAREHAEAVCEACSLIGGPQVRNTATLGGNVCHALPAGDGSIALLALEAQAEVASLTGHRFLPVESLFQGPGRSILDPCREILVGFFVDLNRAGQASIHRRVMRPQGVAIAILNMAMWLERCGDRIKQVRIAVGPAGPIPLRVRRTEDVLGDEALSPSLIEAAVEVLLTEAHFRTSPHRATSEYRQHIAGVLLEETLTTAWLRAG